MSLIKMMVMKRDGLLSLAGGQGNKAKCNHRLSAARRKPGNHAESRQVILNFIEETQRINSFYKSGKYEQSPQQKTAEVHPNFPDNMFLVNLQIQS